MMRVLALAAVMSLTGCASFVANNTNDIVGKDSGERSLGQVIMDNSIERTAKINMYKLDSRFKQSRINIISFYNNILMTGQVADISLRQLAEENVKNMSDVKQVHNYITVGNQIGYPTIMRDLAVTANVKSLIARAPLVSNRKVTVHTEDGVLYVLGRLNNAEIADLNQQLQNVGDVTKIITLIDNVDVASPAPVTGTDNVMAQPTVITTPLNDNPPAVTAPAVSEPIYPTVQPQNP